MFTAKGLCCSVCFFFLLLRCFDNHFGFVELSPEYERLRTYKFVYWTEWIIQSWNDKRPETERKKSSWLNFDKMPVRIMIDLLQKLIQLKLKFIASLQETVISNGKKKKKSRMPSSSNCRSNCSWYYSRNSFLLQWLIDGCR